MLKGMMFMHNKTTVFNNIREKLTFLFFSLKINGSLNLLDQNIHLESFMCQLLNLIFKFNLTNSNIFEQNYPAFDLIDKEKKVIIQVTTNVTKVKVNSSIDKLDDQYKNDGYKMMFVGTEKISNGVKKEKYISDTILIIDENESFLDLQKILSYIINLDMDLLNEISILANNEIHSFNDMTMSSDLAEIVNFLSEEHKKKYYERKIPIAFDIDSKVQFNELNKLHKLIKNNSKYYDMINQIYDIYANNGNDISTSINDYLLEIYYKKSKELSGDELFVSILDEVNNFIKTSSNFNFTKITKENLKKCILIIVVDSFIKCNIFDDPEGYRSEENHDTTLQ